MNKYNNYRISDINRQLNIMGVNPLDIMATGVTGAGKSTTLNAIFQKEVATVGKSVDPETMDIDSYSLNDSLRLWDTPGLGDGLQKDTEHSKKIIDLLYKTYANKDDEYGFIDLVLVIIEGSNRDMGTTYKLLNEIISPNIHGKRVVVAINQADMAMKGRNWNYSQRKPNELLLSFLQEQAISIKSRVKEATGFDIPMPVCYSAEYNYNITALLDLIICLDSCDHKLSSFGKLYQARKLMQELLTESQA